MSADEEYTLWVFTQLLVHVGYKGVKPLLDLSLVGEEVHIEHLILWREAGLDRRSNELKVFNEGPCLGEHCLKRILTFNLSLKILEGTPLNGSSQDIHRLLLEGFFTGTTCIELCLHQSSLINYH